MHVVTRIALTLLLLAACAAALVVFVDRQPVQIGASLLAVVMIGAIWTVGSLNIKDSLRGANHPAILDKEAKSLIDMIYKNFNESGIEEIGKQTQSLIIAAMRRIKDGKIKNQEQAVLMLNPIPASQFSKARDVKFLAATIAAYYFKADDDSDFGFKTKTRVNNFIAGINDTSL